MLGSGGLRRRAERHHLQWRQRHHFRRQRLCQGGSSYFPKAGSTGGQALAQGVTLAGTSNRSLTDGALRHGGSRLGPGRTGRRLSQNRGCFPRRGLERADAAVRRRAVPGPAQGKAELTPSRQTIPSAWPRTPTRCTRLTPIKSTAPAAFGKNCRAAGAVPFFILLLTGTVPSSCSACTAVPGAGPPR